MAMSFKNYRPARAFTVRNGAANCWALEALTTAGAQGCTPINSPAPRWSAYVHKLHKLDVAIDKITEPHDGPFAGHHAHYVLACNVTPQGGCGMTALRIAVLSQRYGLDADRAAMLAGFTWGAS